MRKVVLFLSISFFSGLPVVTYHLGQQQQARKNWPLEEASLNLQACVFVSTFFRKDCQQEKAELLEKALLIDNGF
jgi:3-phenylpropionate/cinnamic acid dioxygenase small subunit